MVDVFMLKNSYLHKFLQTVHKFLLLLTGPYWNELEPKKSTAFKNKNV